jgi:N-acetylmuramoyl-L-alanine amidase
MRRSKAISVQSVQMFQMNCPCILLSAAKWLALPVLLLAYAPQAVAGSCSRPVRIALDVGHSASDTGTPSASGKTEYAFNRRFALELQRAGRSHQGRDIFVIDAGSTGLTLQERTAEARRRAADLFVSIHHDSMADKYLMQEVVNGRKRAVSNAFQGFSVFVSAENGQYERSLNLARLIARQFKNVGMTQTLHHAEPIAGENRRVIDWDLGIYEAPFVVIKTAASPAVLLELGVLVNPKDEAKLERPAYRARMTRAILRAIDEFCGVGAPPKRENVDPQ